MKQFLRKNKTSATAIILFTAVILTVLLLHVCEEERCPVCSAREKVLETVTACLCLLPAFLISADECFCFSGEERLFTGQENPVRKHIKLND